ncbi:MAG: hypothetical protein CMJ47_03575 [Planctomyces sp.]|nr:hypothetical protein [Planctomyces sp.]
MYLLRVDDHFDATLGLTDRFRWESNGLFLFRFGRLLVHSTANPLNQLVDSPPHYGGVRPQSRIVFGI